MSKMRSVYFTGFLYAGGCNYIFTHELSIEKSAQHFLKQCDHVPANILCQRNKLVLFFQSLKKNL